MLPFQIARMRTRYFARWAKMRNPFTGEKHTLDGKKICYSIQSGKEYANHLEMAGFYAASIISYGADSSGSLRVMRHVAFPSLRMYPNLTGSHLDHNFKGITFSINQKPVKEKALRFEFDGILHLFTDLGGIRAEHCIFTAPNRKACVEKIRLRNTTGEAARVQLHNHDHPTETKPCYGMNRAIYRLYMQEDPCMRFDLQPGEEKAVSVAYCAAAKGEQYTVDCEAELRSRQTFLKETETFFIVNTPNEMLNTMAAYAKIRACESIFQTKAGLMHSPGGGYFYAAIWTNDQCEYINPLYAYLGYETGVRQALNTYKMYQHYISPEKALITSIIAQGEGVWHGAKDRGDSAMYAYGCSRFLLSLGDRETALLYLDSIRDCIAYTLSQIEKDGVVRSDSDELENRFESGSYNLCTSCLAYDALKSCAFLENELGDKERTQFLLERADKLSQAIETYFGAQVEGYHTYRYCREETNLRSWIAAPLTMGLTQRADETVRALISDKLLKNDGLVTRSGEKVFWDRSTLYALRGMFYCGKANEALRLLKRYSSARLLGEHIPYAVEAFPEGNQAQLSAESGLYLRIYSEGILGYRPTGLKRFEIKPNLPAEWDVFSIEQMRLCGQTASVSVKRVQNAYEITVKTEKGTQRTTGQRAVFSL